VTKQIQLLKSVFFKVVIVLR